MECIFNEFLMNLELMNVKAQKSNEFFYSPTSLRLHRRCFAFPLKLKVSTNSPWRVSLCRTRNMPCPLIPLLRTWLAASDRDNVPWNHGYSRIFAVKSGSTSASTSKSPSPNSKLLDVDIRSPWLRPIVSGCTTKLLGRGVVVVVSSVTADPGVPVDLYRLIYSFF